jgi:hypothetical protein
VALALLLGALFMGCVSGVARAAASPPAGNVPVGAEVEEALRKVVRLVESGEAQRVVWDAHAAWVASRSSHCAALARVEDHRGARQGCFAAMDAQRVEALKAMRIPLLLARPAQWSPGAIRKGLGIPLDQNRHPDGLALAPTGWLAAVGTVEGVVDLYDLLSGQRLRSLVAERYASNLTFTPNGRLLLVGSRQVRGLQLWDVHSGEMLREIKEAMGPFALSRDNRHAFFTDGQRGLGVFDLVAGTMVGPFYWVGGATAALAVDPAGVRVAVATSDGTLTMLTMWEAAPSPQGGGLALTKLVEGRLPPGERLSSITFSADGNQLFVTVQQRLEIWNVRDLQRQALLEIGTAIAGPVQRVPNADLVLFPVRQPPAPERGRRDTEQTMLVVDPRSHEAALLDDGLTARALLAPMPGQGLVLAATLRDLRAVAIPERRAFRPLAAAVPPAPEPLPQRSPYAYGGTSLPLVRDLPADVRVEAVGVYEGQRPPGPTPRHNAVRTPRPVDLTIGATDRPLMLVLSSHEPVIWRITAGAGARVGHILLSGHGESAVVGLRGVEVTRIGGAYAYQLGAGGYAQLNGQVLQYVGRSIERFQGGYTGTSFSIGRVDQNTFRCVDGTGVPVFSDRGCAPPGVQPSGTPQEVERGPAANRGPGLGAPPGARVFRCGQDTIACDASDTVICGGRRVPCK